MVNTAVHFDSPHAQLKYCSPASVHMGNLGQERSGTCDKIDLHSSQVEMSRRYHSQYPSDCSVKLGSSLPSPTQFP